MRNLTIGTAEMSVLCRLNQEGALRLKAIGPQNDLELLGFVQGSYRGNVSLFSGGGSHRRYIITSAGLDFLERHESYRQKLYPGLSPTDRKAT